MYVFNTVISKTIFNNLIQSLTADYIIIITGRSLQGRLMGHDIFRATDFDILPLSAVSTHAPPHPVESHLLALVRSHLYGGNFLFSYTYDLTRRMQAQWETRDHDAAKALWQVVRTPPQRGCSGFILITPSRSMSDSSGTGLLSVVEGTEYTC